MADLAAIVRRAVRINLGVLPRPSPSKAAPTVAMYFLDPLSALVGGPEDRGRKPIIRWSPTLFACGDTAVVIRYAGPREFGVLNELKPSRVYYVIDDDLYAAGPGDGLPADYRRRLVKYRNEQLPKLLSHVTHVVAPNEAILERYRGKVLQRLDPCQCHAPGGLVHHDWLDKFEIVVPGTRSHLRDIGHLTRALVAFLEERPDAALTTFLGGDSPAALARLPNAVHLPPLGWDDYRRFVAENRFHVAVTPSLDTTINRARSISKIHDHAGFGAAGLYSHRAPFAAAVEDGINGLLLPDDPASWLLALRQLHAGRAGARAIAAGGQALSQRLGDPGLVRAFWADAFGTSW